MTLLGMAITVAMLSAARPALPPPCGVTPSNAGRFYLETERAASPDTVFVHVCLVPAAGTRAASYHAELTYDSTRVRAMRVAAVGGMQVANLSPVGRVALAGVATAGFAPGLLVTVAMRAVAASAFGAMDLRLLELTDATGRSMASTVTTVGFPPAAAHPETRRAPHIDSLAPRKGAISAEDVSEVMIHGRGFTANDNQVFFGGQKVGVVPSEERGSVTRFHVPTTVPGRRGQLSMRIAPGRYPVRLRNANGTSNSVTFIVLP